MNSTTSPRAALSLIAGALWATGCFNAGVPPRTGDVARAGQIGGGASMTVATVAPSEASFVDGSSSHTAWGTRGWLHPMALMFAYVPTNTRGRISVGLLDGFEANGDLGFQQQGLTLRTALLQRDSGRAVALALSTGGAYRPFMKPHQPWLHAGLDASAGSNALQLLTDAHLTLGPETHAILVPRSQALECDGFGEPGCSEYGPPNHYTISRRELRLQINLGLVLGSAERESFKDLELSDFFADDPGAYPGPTVAGRWLTHIDLTLAPYFVLWTDDYAELRCTRCRAAPVDLREQWGVSLLLGVGIDPISPF